ncbi:MAG: 1-phosphofructokinase family hexose kinase [Phycisphaerae bacterium]|nr:1-phosphofructokinase family hexose kinase [Phycisphaerae bacterium]
MILCVSPNPAIDRNLIVPSVKPGAVLRASETLVMAGGKGVNVARAVRTLGGEALIAGPLGGASGRIVADLAMREGLRAEWTWIDAETRTCIIAIPPNAADVAVINEPGPVVSPTDWQRVHEDILKHAVRADAVCICGSMPLGCTPGAMGELVTALRQTGRQVWVDTSKDALRSAIDAKPHGLKINIDEAGDVLGREIATVADGAAGAARELHEKGVDTVVLTLGERGAVLADRDACWRVVLPTAHTVCAVGSGDSFMAGLVTALSAGQEPPEALKRAAAAGAANALSVGAGRFAVGESTRVLPSVRCVHLS